MDANDRALIDGLFDKVRQAESQGAERDADAEAAIAEHLKAQPHAPYYMAQGLVMLEESLKVAESRIEQLEAELRKRPAAGGGGLLGGLFGGGAAAGARGVPAPVPAAQQSPILNRAAHGQGGFMGGAMQTMMAVAGGIMLGNLLGAALMPDMAQAAEEPPADDEAAAMEEDMGGMEEMDVEW